MKITAFLNRQAPEICYFTVNGIRYREKPMTGKQVDWYRVMYDKKVLHPVTEIRHKHFKKGEFVKYAEIKLVWPQGFEYLNVKGRQRFTSYKQLKSELNTWLHKKHPSYFNDKIELMNGSFMPQPILTIKTRSGFAS